MPNKDLNSALFENHTKTTNTLQRQNGDILDFKWLCVTAG